MGEYQSSPEINKEAAVAEIVKTDFANLNARLQSEGMGADARLENLELMKKEMLAEVAEGEKE